MDKAVTDGRLVRSRLRQGRRAVQAAHRPRALPGRLPGGAVGRRRQRAAAMATYNGAMQLMGQWAPGHRQRQLGRQPGIGEGLGWFPFPAVDGGAGDAVRRLGGGNGFAVGKDAPPETVDFLQVPRQQRCGEPVGRAQLGHPPDDRRLRGVGHRSDMKSVLDGRAKAKFVQLYLDQATTPAARRGDQRSGRRRCTPARARRRRWPRPSTPPPPQASSPSLTQQTDGPAADAGPFTSRVVTRWRLSSARALVPAASLRAWGVAGLFLLPALALYALFVLFPIVQAARYSLFDWNGLEPLDRVHRARQLPACAGRPGLPGRGRHNAFIIVLSLVVQIPFALGLALMLNRRFRGRAILRLHLLRPVRHRGGHHRRSSGACSSSPNGLADSALDRGRPRRRLPRPGWPTRTSCSSPCSSSSRGSTSAST